VELAEDHIRICPEDILHQGKQHQQSPWAADRGRVLEDARVERHLIHQGKQQTGVGEERLLAFDDM
jgi:hypothetical protein